jgi:hypothetical protein
VHLARTATQEDEARARKLKGRKRQRVQKPSGATQEYD